MKFIKIYSHSGRARYVDLESIRCIEFISKDVQTGGSLKSIVDVVFFFENPDPTHQEFHIWIEPNKVDDTVAILDRAIGQD